METTVEKLEAMVSTASNSFSRLYLFAVEPLLTVALYTVCRSQQAAHGFPLRNNPKSGPSNTAGPRRSSASFNIAATRTSQSNSEQTVRSGTKCSIDCLFFETVSNTSWLLHMAQCIRSHGAKAKRAYFPVTLIAERK